MIDKFRLITRKRFHELTAGYRWYPKVPPEEWRDGWRFLGELESLGNGDKWLVAAKGVWRRSQRVRKRKTAKYGELVEFRIDDGTL